MLFTNLILAQSVLIGLVPNRASNYSFQWTDGSLVEDGYMNWMDNEPSMQSSEQCVIIDGDEKKWKDYVCAGPKHYACQRSSGESLCMKAVCLDAFIVKMCLSKPLSCINFYVKYLLKYHIRFAVNSLLDHLCEIQNS